MKGEVGLGTLAVAVALAIVFLVFATPILERLGSLIIMKKKRSTIPKETIDK